MISRAALEPIDFHSPTAAHREPSSQRCNHRNELPTQGKYGDGPVSVGRFPRPCVESLVSVVASDLIEKVSTGGRTVSLRTVLMVIQRDACTDTPLFSGEGDTANHTFVVAGDLGSATLTAAVPVVDAISLQTFPFQVNLSWKATGKPEFLKSKETFRDPDFGIKIKTMSRSTQVEATATGTAFGIGQNHTPDASDTATIQKQNDGTHTVQKTP